VARQGKVVQLDAIGLQDLAAKRPMKTDTLFKSVDDKPITSTAVMMLYEDGKLLPPTASRSSYPAFAHPKLSSGPAKRENHDSRSAGRTDRD